MEGVIVAMLYTYNTAKQKLSYGSMKWMKHETVGTDNGKKSVNKVTTSIKF